MPDQTSVSREMTASSQPPAYTERRRGGLSGPVDIMCIIGAELVCARRGY
jgi:hypothetical protein